MFELIDQLSKTEALDICRIMMEKLQVAAHISREIPKLA
jgi:hypothetical protein